MPWVKIRCILYKSDFFKWAVLFNYGQTKMWEFIFSTNKVLPAASACFFYAGDNSCYIILLSNVFSSLSRQNISFHLLTPVHMHVRGCQTETINVTGLNSSVDLILFEMIHASSSQLGAVVCFTVAPREKDIIHHQTILPSSNSPIKHRVMRLLWLLSTQHCFVKDDTIILY